MWQCALIMEYIQCCHQKTMQFSKLKWQLLVAFGWSSAIQLASDAYSMERVNEGIFEIVKSVQRKHAAELKDT
jgi:hypothetical protein